jgi:hypothetical protein
MMLFNLPDLHQPLEGHGFRLFYPYQGSDFTLLTDALEITRRGDGAPDFWMELVRRMGRFTEADTYGRIEFRVQMRDRSAEALTLLRAKHPEARLQPAVFTGGFLRLQSFQLPDESRIELPPPAPLACNGLGTIRSIITAPASLAVKIKGALQGEALALTAVAELALAGVTPRLPMQVSFNPKQLVTELRSLADEQGHLAHDELVAFCRRDSAGLPLQISGPLTAETMEVFAQVMADRIMERFGTFIASPQEAVQPYLALMPPEQVGDGRVDWDLSQPQQVIRPLVLRLDPLDAARRIVEERGVEAVYGEITVPPLPTGVVPITVTANLPDQRPGVLEIGATLYAPPHPPWRMQAVSETCAFTPPDDRREVHLHLSPREAPAYSYSTYAVVQQTNGVNQWNSELKPHAGNWLYLGPDAFPVDFVVLEADRALLDLATLHGTLQWSEDEAPQRQTFLLDLGSPMMALALPKGVSGATLTMEAQARRSDRVVRLGPMPARTMRLGLYSFPEYGPHTVQVTWAVNDGTGLSVIELLPEDCTEADGLLAILAFTPDQPTKTWTYFSQSPFASGYRYRLQHEPEAPPAPWSAICSPFEPLTIQAQAVFGVQI